MGRRHLRSGVPQGRWRLEDQHASLVPDFPRALQGRLGEALPAAASSAISLSPTGRMTHRQHPARPGDRRAEAHRGPRRDREPAGRLRLLHRQGLWDDAARLFTDNATLRGRTARRVQRPAAHPRGARPERARRGRNPAFCASRCSSSPSSMSRTTACAAKARWRTLEMKGAQGKAGQWGEGVYENEYRHRERSLEDQQAPLLPHLPRGLRQGLDGRPAADREAVEGAAAGCPTDRGLRRASEGLSAAVSLRESRLACASRAGTARCSATLSWPGKSSI